MRRVQLAGPAAAALVAVAPSLLAARCSCCSCCRQLLLGSLCCCCCILPPFLICLCLILAAPRLASAIGVLQAQALPLPFDAGQLSSRRRVRLQGFPKQISGGGEMAACWIEGSR